MTDQLLPFWTFGLKRFLNLTKPEHSCILHGCSGFFYLNFFDTTSNIWKKIVGGGIKKNWRWCQIFVKNLSLSKIFVKNLCQKSLSNHEISVFLWRRRHFFGGGGIILSEAEAYIEIVYIDQWMYFFDTTSNKIEKKVGGVRKITTGIFEFDQARALVHFTWVLWLFYLNFFDTTSTSVEKKIGGGIKKIWRWCQKNMEVVSNLCQIMKVGGGGIIFSEAVSNLCQIMKVGGGGVSRNRLYWSINAWIHTSNAFHLHRLQLEIVYIDPLNKAYDFPQPLANGHITLNTPVLVRSLKLSSVEPSQYLDGWPPGNTGCCWQSFFVIIFKICNFFFGGGVDILTRLEYPTFFSTYVKHDRYFWLRLRKKLRVCGTLLYIASKKYMCTLIYATWDFIASMKNMCTLIFAS